MKTKLSLAVISLGLAVNAFAMTDGDIAKTLMTVNMGEISMATMAKQKSKNPEVIKFADHMIMDHKTNNTEAEALLKAEKITPTENPKAVAMDKEGMTTMKTLEGLSGNKFDAAYIESQLNMHKKVLMTLEKEFIPSATNSQFKNLLNKTKNAVATHVDHAQKIQKQMK